MRVWRDRGTASWSSGWYSMGASQSERLHEHYVMSSIADTPERVKAVMQVTHASSDYCRSVRLSSYLYGAEYGCGAMQGFYFDGAGASQGANSRRYRQYGGMVYAFNGHIVNTFAPAQQVVRRVNYGSRRPPRPHPCYEQIYPSRRSP